MMMHKLHKYLEHIKNDENKIQEMRDLICAGLHKLKAHDEDEFNHLMCRIHCIAYGPHFDDELAKKAVSEMVNVDGSHGGHWSMEQAKQIAMQHGIAHPADFYYVLNMMFSDYSAILGNDANNYVKMAKAYICDPDAEEGKAFKLWAAAH